MFYNLSQICELNKILKHYLISSCITYINIFIILQSNKIDFDIPGRRKDIVEKVVGENNNGISRKFILTTSLSKNGKYNPDGLSCAIPQPTLEYGMLCLKNALFLLPTTNCEETNLPITNIQTEDGAKKTIIGHQQQSSLLGSLTPSASHKLGNEFMLQIIEKYINILSYF